MDSLTLFGHLFKTRCEAICIFLDFFTEKRGSHREIYNFFEKVTKCIAFARDFRYTVTRIAPATCRFCAPFAETTYAPSGDENVLGFVYQPFTTQKQLTPRQGTKTGFSNPSCLRPTETTYAPVRGRKLLGGFLLSFCMRLIAYDLTQEKTPYCALRVMPL